MKIISAERIVRKATKKALHHYNELIMGKVIKNFDRGIDKWCYYAYLGFKTNEELDKASIDGTTASIRNFLDEYMIKKGYQPDSSIYQCIFVTQEECDKKCGGSWYYYLNSFR